MVDVVEDVEDVEDVVWRHYSGRLYGTHTHTG